ncbi:fatty acid desaturase [Aurantivibrio plasticivorans]
MKEVSVLAKYTNERVDDSNYCDAVEGEVSVSLTKLLWLGSMILITVFGGVAAISIDALLVFFVSTAVSLCLGHSLGMHRKLIHQSYQCPAWLEYFFVHLGVIVGLAGPFGMIKTHDMRDWAQRQNNCHDYFGHKKSMAVDAFWQLFCDIKLKHPPKFVLEERVQKDKFYIFMQQTWMLQQLPWAMLFYILGGLSWVVWGVCARVSVSVLGHWLIGYFAHNNGERRWHVQGANIQGYNVPVAALLTMGESWHNNHHAYPASAKLGIKPGETDLGWNVLIMLRRLGLVWGIKEPDDLPIRPELMDLTAEGFVNVDDK